MELPNRIVLKSWNVSLHPPKGAGHINVDLALSDVNVLLGDCDLLYLCEFDCSNEEMQRKLRERLLTDNTDERNFFCKGFVPLFHSHSHVKHRSAIFYNANMFEPLGEPQHFYEPASKMMEGDYRVGQLVSFSFCGNSRRIHFFCSHWPGHNETDGDQAKIDAAIALSTQIGTKSSDDFVVCMGDFNAEPYEIMFANLGATRSAKYARERGFLYNPFWNFLHNDYGTLEYSSTRRYKAYRLLYDQIMINGQLLGEYDARATILALNRQITQGEHNPVSIELRRRISNGEI